MMLQTDSQTPVRASNVFTGAEMQRAGASSLVITEGRIAAIEPDPAASASRKLVMPALANAHDHARPLSPTAFGAAHKPLETWLLRLAAVPSVDPHLAALAAFGRAARGGCCSVMAHYTRAMGPMPFADEAVLLARAAAQVGIRATLAVAMRDQNPFVYAPTASATGHLSAATRTQVEATYTVPPLTIAEQVARVEEAAAAAEGPMFRVQYGPTGVQWCSQPLLEAIAESAERHDRRIHMHLLETRYQRAWADEAYPDGVVKRLKEIGLLSPRLALAHCVYAREDELDMIAESGATIVTNASSNLHLASGIAPIGAAGRRGCRIAIGVDASALDEDDDIVRELRLGRFLHAGWGFDETFSREDWLARTLAEGRRANGVEGSGALEVGAAADLLVLDLDRIDPDRIMEVDPLDFLFARATADHIGEVIVAGRTIVAQGRCLGVDLDAVHAELRARYRAGLSGRSEFLAAWADIEPAAADFFRGMAGCC